MRRVVSQKDTPQFGEIPKLGVPLSPQKVIISPNLFFGAPRGFFRYNSSHRSSHLCFLLISVFAFTFIGCAKAKLTPVQRADLDQRAIVEITEALVTLPSSEKLSPLAPELVQKEARMIAMALVDQTRETNKKFRMTTTPNWHNIFIRWGLREEGYCYHWVPELMKALPPYPLKVFERHWGVAYKKLDENNAVLITKRGAPIATGIVYDAWRGSGRPYWKPVAVDKKYRWEVRFREDEILRGETRVSPKNSKEAD